MSSKSVETRLSPLEELAKAIQHHAAVITEETQKANAPQLHLDAPQSHPFDAAVASQRLRDSVAALTSAADMASAIALGPQSVFASMVGGYFKTAALATVVRGGIADYLHQHDPDGKGIHAAVLAKAAETDTDKITKVLRYLTTFYVFSEVSEDHFAINRISLGLVSPSPLRDGCIIAHDQNFLPATRLAEYMYSPAVFTQDGKDPATGKLGLPHSLAYGTDLAFYEWLDAKPQAELRQNFNKAMTLQNLYTTPGLLEDLPWAEVAGRPGGGKIVDVGGGGKIVDVGGGVGSLANTILGRHPQLHATVQDTTGMIAQARQYWDAHPPVPGKQPKVDLQVHDFFAPQPVRDADVYMLRAVLHNWNDEDCARILRAHRPALVRAQGQPKAKPMLLIIDHIIRPAIRPGAGQHDALSSTPTSSLRMTSSLDLQMLCLAPSQERTLAQWQRLADAAGFRIVKLWPVRSAKDVIQMEPVEEGEA